MAQFGHRPDRAASQGGGTLLEHRWSLALEAALWLPAPVVGTALVTPDLQSPDWAALITTGFAASMVLLAGAVVLSGPTDPLRAMRRRWIAHLHATAVMLVCLWVAQVESAAAIGCIGAGAAVLASTLVHLGVSVPARSPGRPAASTDDGGAPTVVVGSGGLAGSSARALSAPDSPYRIVAAVDDDQRAQRRTVGTAAVEGTVADLGKVIEHHRATHVLVAVRDASSSLIQRVAAASAASGAETLVLPTSRELGTDATIDVSHIRAVDPSSYFGRGDTLDGLEPLLDSLGTRSVLVTGAAGDLGRGLCRRLLQLGAGRVDAVDHDESGLLGLKDELGSDRRFAAYAIDLQDTSAVDELIAATAPEIVLHCAAVLEAGGDRELFQANVAPLQHVLDAAEQHRIPRVVHLSSADAADPAGLYGQTRALCEQLVAAAAVRSGQGFSSVRLGSVLGTRASSLNEIAAQVAVGGPVRISHPAAERQAVTVADAVDGILASASLEASGEVLLLEAGTTARDLHVAQYLADRVGGDIAIEFETDRVRRGAPLRGRDEVAVEHPSGVLWMVPSRSVERHVVHNLLRLDDDSELRERLDVIVPSTAPSNDLAILLSPPDVTGLERHALTASFDGGWIAPVGPDLNAFEQELCSYTGAEAAVALSSGSARTR